MKKAAIVYDFDKTLCTKDMQEYSLIPSLGYQDAKEFWKEVGMISKDQKMDSISAYLYYLQKKYTDLGTPLKRSDFKGKGDDIVFYDGVDTWFERINAYGRSIGLEVEHYIISSGMSEIIEETKIAKEFRCIYPCRYFYDENDIAVWPAMLVNYTTKTQYLFRINKQVLDENDDKTLNEYVSLTQRPIPFERMVYIADGITDVPCMRLVKEYGGRSIAVYDKSRTTAEKLMSQGRINYMTKADYSEGSDMEKLMKMILDHMAADGALEDLEGRIR